VYVYEVTLHEPDMPCGTSLDSNPAQVFCCRCVARNALLSVGWTLTAEERNVERALGLLPTDS